MGVFFKLKFKMKLGFECFRQGCQLQDLVVDAIAKTIEEKRALAIDYAQKFMNSEDGVPAYSTSNRQTPKAKSSDDKIDVENLPRKNPLYF